MHNDKHDYPTLKTHERLPPYAEPKGRTVMKDDEGTEADVTASIALAEEANVPKDDVSVSRILYLCRCVVRRSKG